MHQFDQDLLIEPGDSFSSKVKLAKMYFSITLHHMRAFGRRWGNLGSERRACGNFQTDRAVQGAGIEDEHPTSNFQQISFIEAKKNLKSGMAIWKNYCTHTHKD